MLDFMFFTFAGIAVLGALVMAFHHSIVHSIFGLVATLFGVAGLYWTLGADFLGATQIILYVGGITVLLVFAVMLTTRDSMRVEPFRALLMTIPVGFIAWRLWSAYEGVAGVIDASGATPPEPVPTTETIGNLLMQRDGYLLPFEVAAVLLLVVLVGACVLARPRKLEDA